MSYFTKISISILFLTLCTTGIVYLYQSVKNKNIYLAELDKKIEEMDNNFESASNDNASLELKTLINLFDLYHKIDNFEKDLEKYNDKEDGFIQINCAVEKLKIQLNIVHKLLKGFLEFENDEVVKNLISVIKNMDCTFKKILNMDKILKIKLEQASTRNEKAQAAIESLSDASQYGEEMKVNHYEFFIIASEFFNKYINILNDEERNSFYKILNDQDKKRVYNNIYELLIH